MDDKFFIAVDTIEERPITLADGSVEVLHFKHLPNTAFERYAIWCASADDEVAARAASRLVAMGLCNPDGEPAITKEQAERIKRPILQSMLKALLDVNGYGAKVVDTSGKG